MFSLFLQWMAFTSLGVVLVSTMTFVLGTFPGKQYSYYNVYLHDFTWFHVQGLQQHSSRFLYRVPATVRVGHSARVPKGKDDSYRLPGRSKDITIILFLSFCLNSFTLFEYFVANNCLGLNLSCSRHIWKDTGQTKRNLEPCNFRPQGCWGDGLHWQHRCRVLSCRIHGECDN